MFFFIAQFFLNPFVTRWNGYYLLDLSLCFKSLWIDKRRRRRFPAKNCAFLIRLLLMSCTESFHPFSICSFDFKCHRIYCYILCGWGTEDRVWIFISSSLFSSSSFSVCILYCWCFFLDSMKNGFKSILFTAQICIAIHFILRTTMAHFMT